ncbi:hypothetical protein LTR27_007737 [Elasticomyces elasticus]|nr:hypothetical protein LTR27_007737 [Elasticomyces elasticus]
MPSTLGDQALRGVYSRSSESGDNTYQISSSNFITFTTGKHYHLKSTIPTRFESFKDGAINVRGADLGITRRSLHTTDAHSDLTLVCGGRSFKVHKAVLHAQSSVFRTMLAGGFAEANLSTFPLPDDSPDSLEPLLYYMYHDKYPKFISNSHYHNFRVDSPKAIVQAYAIADKYDVPGLELLATQRLAEIVNSESHELHSAILAVRTISECTTESDSTLWDVVVPKVRKQLSWLAGDDSFLKLLREVPELNKKLLQCAAT